MLEFFEDIVLGEVMFGFWKNDWEVPFDNRSYIYFENSPSDEARSGVLENGSGHLLGAFQPGNQFDVRED